MRWKVVIALAFLCIAGAAGGGFYYWHSATASKAPEEKDLYSRFEMEAYDLIQKNYWQKATDAQLANIFQLSLEKASGSSSTTPATDRPSTEEMFVGAFAKLPTQDAKRQLALATLQTVLYNLAPVGRNELLSSQAVTQLRDTVSNVNPSVNLYGELGVPATATVPQITRAYEEAKAKLGSSSSTSSQQKLARLQYVSGVLSRTQTKVQYDALHVEPTVFSHTIGTTLYLNVDKISPATLNEFTSAVDAASSTPLSSMIIDLRGNIGGSLDLAPSLIGLFIGSNQYAFDLYHQGDLVVSRTAEPKFAGFSRYREIAVLTDNMTQSTAELLTAVFKRFHLATVIGGTTRGWGSVENTYPITTSIDPSTEYALLLVNALTVRDDNQPIEGAGVAPDISMSDRNWRAQLPDHLRSGSLIKAIEQIAPRPPLQ